MGRLFFGIIIDRIRKMLEKFDEFIKMRLIIIYFRNEALRFRKKLIRINGKAVVNSNTRKRIKNYSKERFGKKCFWPYLALYSEIRGEFLEGWIPYDFYRFYLLPKINPKPALYLSDLKTLDYRLFGDFAVKPLSLYISGVFYNTDLEIQEPSELFSLFSNLNDKIVIKEEGGWGGLQVNIIHSSEFDRKSLNSRKNYVIQQYIRQYKALNDLYSGSVNTFRINTFLKKDGSIIVKYVWLRFGSDGGKVDNLTSGGNYLFFNLDGKPESKIYDSKLGIEIGEKHKSTNYLFSDIKIPMFEEMLRCCATAHKKVPYARLIAWDVCITEAGIPKLLEWNTNNPDFDSQEARFGPFWKEEIISEF